MSDHHAGCVPVLPAGPADRGRRTADAPVARIETPEPVVLQLERGQQTEAGPKVAGATDAVAARPVAPRPSRLARPPAAQPRVRQQIGE